MADDASSAPVSAFRDRVMTLVRAAKGFGGHFPADQAIIYTALASDLAVALIKFWAAHHTGSAAMFSEGVHSTVDALTELLLLYGLLASRQPSTKQHPVGFGREVFFWNFVVAMTILALGAGVALFDGMRQIIRQVPIESPLVSYAVLTFAMVAEFFAVIVALRSIQSKAGARGFRSYFQMSRDATALTVMFSGLSGILGLLVAALGTFLSTHLHRPGLDGLASVTIAFILTVTALFLARSSKVLLIGVPAATNKVNSILAIVACDPSVKTANGALTVHLGPDQILVALSVAFRPDCTTAQIEDAVTALDARISHAHPDVVLFMVKPESSNSYDALERRRGW